MDILTRLQIIKYHQDAIIKFGINSKEALGWKNEKNQLARFNALYNINDLNNHSVLDLGCGIGDFLELLNENKIVCNYTGIDHLKDFIEFAAQKFKLQTNTCFLLGDCYKADLGCYDYILASGTFNYINKDPHFIYKTIAHFYELCNKAFAFNLLENVETNGGNLVTYNKNEIFEFCKKLSPQVILKDNYLVGDFTIIMKNEGI